MAKHTQTIRGQFADKLSVFSRFMGLALKGLKLQTRTETKVLSSHKNFKCRFLKP